ncbi:hypothetical protein L227DRAFT_610027 [Lentinus tigrinus ALCF2SS1-6]|uniref:Uncharacterized protein n=1 Tax=Lentinus tigrinus ALCF2SS1-6 TaxID=1328759 RepID=A0A5C2SCM6_9APHY|nr:hypothetical protein L227DRAFT_610027 [Lentinus tigrinus ALCF2SS1-6]
MDSGMYTIQEFICKNYDDGQSPVQSCAVQEAAVAARLHKCTLSVDPKPPKGMQQGRRSVLLTPKKPRRIEVDDYNDGPFWKPR